MFPNMRRSNQQLTDAECERILGLCTSGVLAVAGDDGYPYAVPLSYAYSGGRIYFHCAADGHKLRAIRRDPKASFCVVERDDVVPEQYTTHYRSVIAFGTVRELDGDDKLAALELLGRRYAPNESDDHLRDEIDKSGAHACVLELTVQHMTGKQARELAEQHRMEQ